jgi:hypothetical protein
MVKTAPFPGTPSLSTHNLPPIISLSRLQMTRPNPVPPYLRVVEASTWLKDWKMRPRRSGGMPMPVSATAKWRTRESGGGMADFPPAVPVPPVPSARFPFRKLHRIVEQVEQNLPQAGYIAGNGGRHSSAI